MQKELGIDNLYFPLSPRETVPPIAASPGFSFGSPIVEATESKIKFDRVAIIRNQYPMIGGHSYGVALGASPKAFPSEVL